MSVIFTEPSLQVTWSETKDKNISAVVIEDRCFLGPLITDKYYIKYM
jgi:hypothetical protein